jgi:UDP-glucuronate 4-epimerase
MPRVLITGAAGFIGMHTAIRFLKEGWDVVGIDNLNDYYSVSLKRDRLNLILSTSEEEKKEFRFYERDLNSTVWQEMATESFSALIHLAAQAGVRYSLENPQAYIESNILGFQSVLDFVSLTKIPRFIYASSSSVYGKSADQPFDEEAACVHPESYYAATKKTNELMAYAYFKTKKIRSVGLRFFTVYGPWGRPDMAPFLFVDSAFKGKEISVFNHGNQKRDFTFVNDIVEGILSSVEGFHLVNGAEIFNIGNGKPTGLMDFISVIEDCTGRKLQKQLVDAQVGDVEVTFADTKKLSSTFGYKPRITLEEGISEFVHWYKGYYGDTHH